MCNIKVLLPYRTVFVYVRHFPTNRARKLSPSALCWVFVDLLAPQHFSAAFYLTRAIFSAPTHSRTHTHSPTRKCQSLGKYSARAHCMYSFGVGGISYSIVSVKNDIPSYFHKLVQKHLSLHANPIFTFILWKCFFLCHLTAFYRVLQTAFFLPAGGQPT